MTELSDDDRLILDAADAIRARRAATEDPEVKRLQYEREVAERDARLAADPDFQASRAEWKRKADQEHKQELDALKALAKLDSPPDPRPQIQTPAGWTLIDASSPARFMCWECKNPIFGNAVQVDIHTLCEPCNARHRLRCDQCQRHDDVITTHFSDNAWRCPDCAADIQPVPAERKMRAAVWIRR
jgi:hypothetical protein